jgi:hypothetical protein
MQLIRFPAEEDHMKRLGLAVIAAAVMFPAAASADPGGVAHDGACGLGAQETRDAIADKVTGPGASEYASLVSPVEFGCTGKKITVSADGLPN